MRSTGGSPSQGLAWGSHWFATMLESLELLAYLKRKHDLLSSIHLSDIARDFQMSMTETRALLRELSDNDIARCKFHEKNPLVGLTTSGLNTAHDHISPFFISQTPYLKQLFFREPIRLTPVEVEYLETFIGELGIRSAEFYREWNKTAYGNFNFIDEWVERYLADFSQCYVQFIEEFKKRVVIYHEGEVGWDQ